MTPPQAAEAFPSAINESGLVALTSSSDGVRRGFVYSSGWFILMTPAGSAANVAILASPLLVLLRRRVRKRPPFRVARLTPR